MTTIAFRDGVMAADGAMMSGWCRMTIRHRKIVRLPDGSLCAGAGSVGGIARFIKWLRSPDGDAPYHLLLHGTDNSTILLARPNGILVEYCSQGAERLARGTKFHAIGSGRDFALGAMEAGAPAAVAVRIACRRDVMSAGRVYQARLAKEAAS